MTALLSGKEVSAKLEQKFPGSIIEADQDSLLIKNEFLLVMAAFLKEEPDLRFNFLSYITAVDCSSYFEVVYQLLSLEYNHSLVLKARIQERDNPSLPSVVGLWRGAELQEREIYDLFGISFEGHPNLKRIVLWEGFPGHPLRKDFKEVGS
ncbi:MAG: NADH-quinone oxidoreductase subunit C [Planctomycetota bacterium]